MSGAQSHSQSPRLRSYGTGTLAQLSSRLTSIVQTIAFWLSIVFPLTYLPLLGGGGIVGSEVVPFVGLVAGHVLALAVGHDYAR